MNIIKDGKFYTVTKQFTCKICGCVFTADKGEYRFASRTEALYEGIEAVCRCPCCDNDVPYRSFYKSQKE